MRITSAAALVFALAVLSAASARAQDAPAVDSFTQLQVVVKPGDTITITDSMGRKAEGSILTLSASTLVLLAEGRRRELKEHEVASISQRRPDSLKNGAWWGLGAGAASGFVLSGLGSATASIWEGPGASASAGHVLTGTVLMAGIGTAIGMAVDAVIKSDRLIYSRASAPVTVGIGREDR
jgi:hypothetical protein